MDLMDKGLEPQQKDHCPFLGVLGGHSATSFRFLIALSIVSSF